MFQKLVVILLIVILGIVAYVNCLNGAFIWDDNSFIVENRYIKDIKLIPYYFTAKEALAGSSLCGENYRPFFILSFAIDYFFWKLNSFGYHVTNLLFHILNAILVFYLVATLVRDKITGLFASLLFLVHPVHTEAVAWISGRADVLFLFFYLIAFGAYIKSRNSKGAVFYFISVFFFTCSLLSKEMAASLPLLIIAYDLIFKIKERFVAKMARYLPFFAILEIYIITRFNVIGKLAQSRYWTGSAYTTFLTMARGVVYYLRLLIWPTNLCVDYSTFPVSSSIREPGVIISIAILLLLTGTAIVLKKRYKIISFAFFWFFITLLPVSNIIPIKILIAERFLYLPSIGFFLTLAIVLKALYRRSAFRIVSIAFLVILVTIYSFLTVRRNILWKDPLVFFCEIVRQCPDNARMHNNLGKAYYEIGKTQKAIDSFKKAIELTPDFEIAWNNLGLAHYQAGEKKEALASFRKAIEINPASAEAYNNLGSTYYKWGNIEEAISAYTKSIALNPNYAPAYRNLALAYYRNHEFAKSLEYCEKAKEFGPVDPRLLNALKIRFKKE